MKILNEASDLYKISLDFAGPGDGDFVNSEDKSWQEFTKFLNKKNIDFKYKKGKYAYVGVFKGTYKSLLEMIWKHFGAGTYGSKPLNINSFDEDDFCEIVSNIKSV